MRSIAIVSLFTLISTSAGAAVVERPVLACNQLIDELMALEEHYDWKLHHHLRIRVQSEDLKSWWVPKDAVDPR